MLKKTNFNLSVFLTESQNLDISGYQGPLAILRKCMQEKLKVVVVIRAAVSVRSRCKGFVIAFDKHFNMV